VKLYVDDIRDPPPGWTVARDVAAAYELLRTSRRGPVASCEYDDSGMVEQLSLDYDLWTCLACLQQLREHLAGHALRPSEGCPCYQTGFDLLVKMQKSASDWKWIWPQKRPVVHSTNPVGTRCMQVFIDAFWPWQT